MGNRCSIIHDGNKIGEINLGLACFAYINTKIIRKYNPHFNMFDTDNNINKQLQVVYDRCTKAEEAQMLLFLNGETTFGADYIPYFKKAIKDYPETLNENPKMILEKFLDLLEKYKELTVTYQYTDMAITVCRN